MYIAIVNHKQHTPCNLLLSGNSFEIVNRSLSWQLYKNKNINRNYREVEDLIHDKCIYNYKRTINCRKIKDINRTP